MEETKVDKVRRLLAMQETFEKDREELKDPTSASWRERLGLQEEATPEQLKKRAKLKTLRNSQMLVSIRKHPMLSKKSSPTSNA
ncbi:MAG: hypothetical protein CM15mV13_1770 [uncultured marine virus]|nr:MAG: hypothetical protein CM15mV13_1770 [uncultured marine virus]